MIQYRGLLFWKSKCVWKFIIVDLKDQKTFLGLGNILF